MLDTARKTIRAFFRTKGFNLALACGAFLAVYLVFRSFHRLAVRPLLERRRSVMTRSLDVLFYVLAFVASVAALFVALASRGDWTLLLIAMLFLAGAAWASIRMLPQFFEQIRLLLNLGSVREGERIIFEGLPWRVDRLTFYSRLKNPELSGGTRRIPVRDLIGLNSRPTGAGELWFPASATDWVILSAGTRGQIACQTPESVHLSLPGGGRKTYPTTDFLALAPRNLSKGFRAEMTFGIDYSHQRDSTNEIPEILKARLLEEMPKHFPDGQVLHVEVEFKEAAASSLDLEILIDMDGAAAASWESIHRRMARIAVDACNEHGWGIPFQQITLHQAE